MRHAYKLLLIGILGGHCLSPLTGHSQAPVPDSKDLRNEINVIRTKQEEQQRHYDEKFKELSKQIDDSSNLVQFVLGLIGVLTVAVGGILRWFGVRDRAELKSSVAELQLSVENAGAELRKRMREMDEALDGRVDTVTDELVRAGEAIQHTIAERMEQTYRKPEELKNEIIGAVRTQFDPPAHIKREVLNEMILLLQAADIVDDRAAKRMHLRVDRLFSSAVPK